MILSQSEEAVGHWWSSEGDIGEPRHHRGEIVAPIEAVFEFGEVAGHMLVTDGTVGASDGALDVSEGRVDPLKGGYQGAAATRSGDDRVMTHPALPTPAKQRRPSLTTVLAGLKLCVAKAVIAARRKPFTRRNVKRTGFPCGVVSTATTIGVLPGEPRPRLPPLRSPPR